MFVLSVLEAPNTKTNSLCVKTHLAIKLFLILILKLNIKSMFLLICLKKNRQRMFSWPNPLLVSLNSPACGLWGTEVRHVRSQKNTSQKQISSAKTQMNSLSSQEVKFSKKSNHSLVLSRSCRHSSRANWRSPETWAWQWSFKPCSCSRAKPSCERRSLQEGGASSSPSHWVHSVRVAAGVRHRMSFCAVVWTSF